MAANNGRKQQTKTKVGQRDRLSCIDMTVTVQFWRDKLQLVTFLLFTTNQEQKTKKEMGRW